MIINRVIDMKKYIVRFIAVDSAGRDIQDVADEYCGGNYNMAIYCYRKRLGYLEIYVFDGEKGEELVGSMRITFVDGRELDKVYNGKIGDSIDKEIVQKMNLDVIEVIGKGIENEIKENGIAARSNVYIVSADKELRNNTHIQDRSLIVMRAMQELQYQLEVAGAQYIVSEVGLIQKSGAFKELMVKWNRISNNIMRNKVYGITKNRWNCKNGVYESSTIKLDCMELENIEGVIEV